MTIRILTSYELNLTSSVTFNDDLNFLKNKLNLMFLIYIVKVMECIPIMEMLHAKLIYRNVF